MTKMLSTEEMNRLWDIVEPRLHPESPFTPPPTNTAKPSSPPKTAEPQESLPTAAIPEPEEASGETDPPFSVFLEREALLQGRYARLTSLSSKGRVRRSAELLLRSQDRWRRRLSGALYLCCGLAPCRPLPSLEHLPELLRECYRQEANLWETYQNSHGNDPVLQAVWREGEEQKKTHLSMLSEISRDMIQ